MSYLDNNSHTFLYWDDENYEILRQEYSFIQKRRKNISDPDEADIDEFTDNDDTELLDNQNFMPTTKLNLVGLCLSGGGIRSATFNLGFIQALYKYNLLYHIDYLSTVSGGGYIGSCLTSLLNSEVDASFTPQTDFLWRKENFPFARPDIRPKTKNDTLAYRASVDIEKKISAEKAPVRHLRYFSNYLTQGNNFISTYFSPMVVFTRGVIFNFLVILPVLILLSTILTGLYRIPINNTDQSSPLFINLAALTKALHTKKAAHDEYRAFVLNHISNLEVLEFTNKELILSQSPRYAAELNSRIEKTEKADSRVRNYLWAIARLPIFAFLVMIVTAMFYFFILQVDQAKAKKTGSASKRSSLPFFSGRSELQNRALFNTIFSYLFAVTFVFFLIELYGAALAYWNYYDVPDKIAFVSLLTFFGPLLLQRDKAAVIKDKKWSKIIGSVILLILAPLVLLYVTGILVNTLNGNYLTFFQPFSWLKCMIVFLFGVGLLYYTNFRMNINKISLHNFYRDRLTSAYILQGKRKSEDGGPFQEVEQKDELKLSELYSKSYSTGPYHLINTNLNLKKHLPDEKLPNGVFRRGESFIFSKLWCGSAKTGYRSTVSYEEMDSHLDLGSTMAISGAAVNIGMGVEGASTLRFLMGILNLRLGYWAYNPDPLYSKNAKWHGKTIPGTLCAIREWLGLYPLKTKFISLSDGGHFDNIGVYELLRRRCKYIIVADAEADPQMKFQALAYLIRIARIDFAIEIKIDISGLQRDTSTQFSDQHCAVGTIKYPKKGYQDEEMGYLLYCKSSLTGDEPAHLNEYHIKHPQFPHETTADQWFSEQQFEAYRELGYHVGKRVLKSVTEISKETSLEDLFLRLKEFWYPRSQLNTTHFTQHSAELNRLFDFISSHEELDFMDSQIYPEWQEMMEDSDLVKKPADFSSWLPDSAEKRRAGFYICNQMMQLMENVYLDLNLENHYKHPDNRGWMNLFIHWSWSSMFRITWAISACTFGAKFQKFCEKHLNLSLGTITVEKYVADPEGTSKEDTVLQMAKDHLNPYEFTVVSYYLDCHDIVPQQLYTLSLKIDNPVIVNQYIEFIFGFSLVYMPDKERGAQLCYFRIQDHLRRMGLGRQAMEKLVQTMLEDYGRSLSPESCIAENGFKFLNNLTAPQRLNQRFAQKYEADVVKLNQMLESVLTELRDYLENRDRF